MTTFIRTIHSDSLIECSWYDKNGRRYKHENSTYYSNGKTVAQGDNRYGYMAYAIEHNFKVIDNYIGEHPKRI